MREKVNEIQISIPEELGARVGAALGEVRRLHRKRVLRRAGAVMGSFVAVVGVMLGMAAVNPAMASQIPLVGDWLGSLFYQANYDSKVGAGGAFVETYGAMEDVNVSAASGEWQVTFGEGYTDGTSLVVSMELTGPQGTAGAVPLCLGRSRGPDCRCQWGGRPDGGRQRLCGAGRQMDLHHDGAGA